MDDSKDPDETRKNVKVIPEESARSVNPEEGARSMNPEDSDKSEVILENDSEVPECSDNSLPQEETEDLKSQSKQKPYNINLLTKSFLFRKNDEISVLNPLALLKIYGLNNN